VFLDEAKLHESARSAQQKCVEKNYVAQKEQNNTVRGDKENIMAVGPSSTI